MTNFNVLAVLVAALSSFMLGGLWYSDALFGKAWRREAGDDRVPGQGHPAKVFGLSFVFALVAAFAYAWLVPAPATATVALAQGLVAGAGIVAASFGINYQFAGHSAKLWLIDGGYHAVQFVLYGLIIGLWR
jgi:uncharacterized membrane protein YagU involved in acid resistance